MAWSIGLNLTESFAEVVARQDQQQVGQGWFLPRKPLVTGLKELKEKLGNEPIDGVHLSTKSVQSILQRRLGTVPALLVTSGFENWLEMSLPIDQDFFTIQPQRASSPMDRELIFGINERTAADGSVEKSIDEKDLEFLLAKLQMNNVNTVAVALLHSEKNCENENKVSHFFGERGFRVFDSSDTKTMGNEKNSWWATLLSAYAAPTFREIIDELKETLAKALGSGVTLDIAASGGSLGSADSGRLLYSQFANMELLRKKYHEMGGAGVAYFGYEDFWFTPFNQPQSSLWKSDFGRLNMGIPYFVKLKTQPTQIIEQTFWGSAGYSKDIAGFEPGPMFLGRGLHATFLDILSLQGQLEKVSALNDLLSKNSHSRCVETLDALSNTAHDRVAFDNRQMLHWLEEMALMNIVMDLQTEASSEIVHCVGPLAKAIVPQILEWDVKVKLKLHDNSDFCVAEALT